MFVVLWERLVSVKKYAATFSPLSPLSPKTCDAYSDLPNRTRLCPLKCPHTHTLPRLGDVEATLHPAKPNFPDFFCLGFSFREVKKTFSLFPLKKNFFEGKNSVCWPQPSLYYYSAYFFFFFSLGNGQSGFLRCFRERVFCIMIRREGGGGGGGVCVGVGSYWKRYTFTQT